MADGEKIPLEQAQAIAEQTILEFPETKVLIPHKGGRGKKIDYSQYTHKLCSVCKKIKPISNFSKEKKKESGNGWRYRACCMVCKRPYSRQFATKKRRLHGIRERTKRSKDTSLKAQRIASRKHYYKHLEQEKKRVSQWRKDNPEKQRFMEKRRRARKKNAQGRLVLAEWERIKAEYGGLCVFCQRSEPDIKLTQDHIIPLSKGGSDNAENIQPLCFSCNSSKGDKLIYRLEEDLLRFCL